MYNQICPHCGKEIASESPQARPWKNEMSTYVKEDGSPFGVMNDDSKEITIPASEKVPTAFKVIRQDVYNESKRLSTIEANKKTQQDAANKQANQSNLTDSKAARSVPTPETTSDKP